MRLSWLLFAGLLLGSPVIAQETDPLAPLEPDGSEPQTTTEPATPSATKPSTTTIAPTPPPRPVVIPKNWSGVLTAIRNGEWEAARLGIEALPNGPLKPYARAELYTAKDSPKVELGPILGLLEEAPELPQAEQLYRMAISRGAHHSELPSIFWPRPTISLGSAPRRGKTRPVAANPMPTSSA